jgi:hypothetical protein
MICNPQALLLCYQAAVLRLLTMPRFMFTNVAFVTRAKSCRNVVRRKALPFRKADGK